MTTNKSAVVVHNIRNWMKDNHMSIQTLATKASISKSLLGHILTGQRKLQDDVFDRLAIAMEMPRQQLETAVPLEQHHGQYTLNLRGKADSRIAKRHLRQLLLAVEDCVAMYE
ncbi:helix-turn-helix domain-containing protein [Paenibacillus sp. WLX2291]|uniref:helix-turn-helix domain-containing protein n=1 Tax=Paenibacillus sp. WLX2291 TaxID=3296934 RepID=UPI0039845377